ncbi:F0F1 ATP synthase subunit B [Blattabacterium cuenoti]|uniref:F0F1 ATP synthase subunit B n=1 Tax=Blattabacterium cuenoti TaxID=1653831 RepID=UPI00163BC09B|nr:F0F1 ATP synthase subunit B [Blattabacterium cuenoti]
MDLVTPSVGLIFWHTIIFLMLMWVLNKFAWHQIINFINERENKISMSMKHAKKLNEELRYVESKKNKILKYASLKKDLMLKEAIQIKNKIQSEAKKEGLIEKNKIIGHAKKIIEKEKKEAIFKLKKEIANISINIAEKILKKKLEKDDEQKKFMEKIINN